MTLICTVLLALVLCRSVLAAENADERLQIGTIGEELGSNGGCSLQLPRQYAKKEGKYVFTSDFQGRALINVGGVDTAIELVRSKDSDSKQKPQIGEHSTHWYAGAGLEVQVDYVVTGVCPRANESCRVTYYDATLAIKRGKAGKRFAAKAACAN